MQPGLLTTPRRDDGMPRRLGIELEFSGIPLEEIARIVAWRFGGEIAREGKYRYHVASSLGPVGIELDVQLMHKLNAHFDPEAEGPSPSHRLEEFADACLRPIVDLFSPSEIVLPPIAPEAIPEIEALIETLRHHGAQGTGARLLYAFGMHVNIDVPSFSAASILAYIQSFILLQEWLIDALDMDMTRRISPFAKLFPAPYARLVLARRYAPDMAQLIDDYLVHNPTRNRALDLLPLFAWIDEERVRASLDDTLIKRRPVFHFRMPNCRIDEAGWTASSEIGCWAEVERLAENHAMRREMADAYLANPSRLRHPFDRMWHNETTPWLMKDPA